MIQLLAGATGNRMRHIAWTAAAASLLTACRLPGADASSPQELAVDQAPARLAALAIAPEDSTLDYDRENWPHWSYIGDGCDIRALVLQREGRDVTVTGDCDITSGTWFSVYDGVTVTDDSDLDVDHIVALGEVADSGARHWTEAQRERYANDTRSLIAVTASSNRAKSSDDPAEWLPPRAAYRCTFVKRWITIKVRYELSADPAERAALAEGLASC